MRYGVTLNRGLPLGWSTAPRLLAMAERIFSRDAGFRPPIMSCAEGRLRRLNQDMPRFIPAIDAF